MKSNKKSVFSIKPIICLMMLAVCVVVFSSVMVHAAGKKTVRVTSVEELVSAVNDSSVGTIIFRSETRDSVTIPSNKNAKSKKLVIDCRYANITNKAVFNYITIQGTKKFTEAVSGNTIEIALYNLSQLELSKKKKIKKLVLTSYNGFEGTDAYSVIRKGAKVKSIVYKTASKTVKMDKASKTLAFSEDAFEWGEPTEVVMKFDKSGRLVFRSEDYEDENENDTEYIYKYDKNGNMLDARGYVYYEGEDKNEVEVKTYTYDSKNRMTSAYDQSRYSAIVLISSYYYDKKGRLNRMVTEGSTIDGDKVDNSLDSVVEYFYDSKGRNIRYIVEDAEHVRTYEYEYNDFGYLVTEKEIDSEFPSECNLEVSTYDKSGNLVKTVYTTRSGEVTTAEYSYDELGEWEISVWVYPDGEEYVYYPGMAG